LFLDYAGEFWLGLATGDLSLTFGLGYPGATLAWFNILGLLGMFVLSRLGWLEILPTGLSVEQFLGGMDILPLPYYVAARAGTVLLVTVSLLLIYGLGRRLFGAKVAWLSALLLALDPSMLGYSRLVHHDMPMSLLMMLAIITWLLWLREERRAWLLWTGVFTGLAVLTKTIALLIPPVLAGLALLVWLIEDPPAWRNWRALKPWFLRTVSAWLATLIIGAVVFYALWPAMWQNPTEALQLTFKWLWDNKDAGFGNWGAFWLGEFRLDPGPWFYPTALVLKLSPLMTIGLVVNLFSLRRTRDRAIIASLWVYGIVYIIAMNFGPTKSVRYLLPAMAAFAPLAGYGLTQVEDWVASWRPRGQLLSWAMAAGFTVLLLGASLPYAPLYLSYYNPLLLGWRWAPKVIQVGWGEGLSNAARYLNRQPHTPQTVVAAWYHWSFAPYFEGQTIPISGENAMKADYTVFYINQVQRNIPDPNLISYFQRRQPQQIIRLNGIDYAWIYPAISRDGPLPAGATPVSVSMGEAVILEGYEVQKGEGDGELIITLHWRGLKPNLPEYFVYVRAIDETGEIRARSDSPPVMGFWPTPRWQPGQLVADAQILQRPPEISPGVYRLEVGMYDPATWAVLEPAHGERGGGGGLLLGTIELP
jgi:4-amino-4-deoxy-L-arabinose transferase-like glycosyltransferase